MDLFAPTYAPSMVASNQPKQSGLSQPPMSPAVHLSKVSPIHAAPHGSLRAPAPATPHTQFAAVSPHTRFAPMAPLPL